MDFRKGFYKDTMNAKAMINKMNEVRSTLGLMATVLDMDSITCQGCGEPYDIDCEAIKDLVGHALLAFEFTDDMFPKVARCPSCNPIENEAADYILPLLRHLPSFDDPDTLIDMLDESIK